MIYLFDNHILPHSIAAICRQSDAAGNCLAYGYHRIVGYHGRIAALPGRSVLLPAGIEANTRPDELGSDNEGRA